jgi:hypothetical protein
MAAGAPQNADLQYLAIRCVEGHPQQDQAFLDLNRRFPENPWAAQAAGFALAGQARWQQALALIDDARKKLPGLAEQLAVEAARIRRMADGVDAEDGEAHSTQLDRLRSAESGDDLASGMQKAYGLLARGDLKGALAAASADQPEQPRLLRLAAASRGASPELVRQGLDLSPDKGLDSDTLLPAMALAALAGRTLEPYRIAAGRLLNEEAGQMLKAFALLQAGAGHAQIEDAILGLAPEDRGHVYVAAAVLRGPACPPDWRLAARRLLFVPERPYL